jgi:hypothetical protein
MRQCQTIFTDERKSVVPLHSETRELIEFAPRSRVKEIVKKDVLTLS